MILITLLLLIVVIAVKFGFQNIWNTIRVWTLVPKLPGPKHYFLVGNLFQLICDEVTMFKNLRRWGQQYSPLYRLNAVHVYSINISSPEDFEIIASTTKNTEKSHAYKFFYLWLGDGLLTSTGKKWQIRRKILTPAFHFSILQQFIGVFTNETENLVKVLKQVCHEPYTNVVPYISQFTLNAINETSMGIRLNLENEDDKNYYLATHKIGKIILHRIMRPWFYVNSIYYALMPLGQNEKKLVKTLHSFTENVIKQRSKEFVKFDVPLNENDETFNYSKRKKLAMLDLLLNAKFTNGTIDDEGIKDEVNTFMFEGHDTTSMALCFTLMLLAQHDDVQDLIVEEINNVLVNWKAQPTYNDLQELKYMERCIKECLRLYPSVPTIGRLVDGDIKTSNGHVIPQGTMIHLHIFDIHRNPKFWPNPEKFDPDRFLPENSQDRHPFAYVPFSAGPRNCIGQRFAILELKVALCGILRNFKLAPVDTPETMECIIDIVLRAKNDIVRVKFIPRGN